MTKTVLEATIRSQELAERALDLSRADECAVLVDEVSDVNLRWANNTLTTNGAGHSQTLTVIATFKSHRGTKTGTQTTGTSVGVVTRDGITLSNLEALIRSAETAAQTGGVAEDAMPFPPPCDRSANWDQPCLQASLDVFTGSMFIPQLGAALARASRDRRILLFGYVRHSSRSTYLASSTGLRLRHDQLTGYVEINAWTADRAFSTWAGVPAPRFEDVNVSDLMAQLERRLRWGRRKIELPAGRYETLLPPTAVGDLMVHLYLSAGARDACDGRTVFSKPGGTRIGEHLSSLPLTMRSNPSEPGLQCSPFVIAHNSGPVSSVFDNGLGLRPTRWIDQGKLSFLHQTRNSAQHNQLPLTPLIDNLVVEGQPGGPGLDQMIASTRRGLLLTCLWYLREVDPRTLLLTGLTRDGVFLIEDGEVVGTCNNFRFNESPVDLLKRIMEIGATEKTLARQWSEDFTRTAMPPMRVENFNMSTVSEAL